MSETSFSFPQNMCAAGQCLAVAALILTPPPAGSTEAQTVGWVERVKIGEQGFLVEAKLDTGADSSSLNAQNIHVYSRERRFWVRFEVTNYRWETARFDLPVRRFVKIKRHGGKSVERPVVAIDICVGRIKKVARVTLADRSRFRYAVLIGREFLAAGKLVDSSRRYLMEPDCQ